MAGLALEVPPGWVEAATAYGRAEGEATASLLLARCPGVTALACANDLLALGAYDACRRAGLRIPAEVSVTGHNDMPLVDMIEPPLTTVRIPHEEMGRRAARLLLDRIHHGAEVGTTVLASVLVQRGSTAPPAGA